MYTKNLKEIKNLNGLSSVDFFISLVIFVVFISVFITVAQVIIKFSGNYQGNIDGDPGIVADKHNIYVSFEKIVDILSQPVITKEEIIKITKDKTIKCSNNPSKDWNLIGPNILVPFGYKFCLSSTPLDEAAKNELFINGKPGIYTLHAVPEKINVRNMPLRRIFCRPKPYC